MCLMVWIGTTQPMEAVARSSSPDPIAGYSCIEPVADDAPVRGRFTSRHVAYVGPHEGCGCGYQSGSIAFEGAATVAEAHALAGAMLDDERAGFEAEERSRARLRDLVERASRWGPVEVFACWAGDEAEPAVATRDVDSTWRTSNRSTSAPAT